MLIRLALLTVFVVTVSTVAEAQVQTWWAISGTEESTESGKLQEIKEKRRLFLTVNYRNPDPDQVNAVQERDLIRKLVLQSISSYEGFEVVTAPERADVAISITASVSNGDIAGQLGNFSASLDPSIQTSMDIFVLIRGAMQRYGDYRPRIVWELSSPNVRGEPASAAAFAIDGFIEQLKKVRGEKKKGE